MASNSSTTLCAIIAVISFAELALGAHNSTSSQQIVVSTTSGHLLGTQQRLTTNATVYKFLAIPYAEPPTGALRFMRPVELRPERQQSTLDASKFGKTCPQFRHLARFISPLLNLDPNHETSEDCLHLNVYVPSAANVNEDKRLPVIVWIPGEGFDFADARQFDGSHLADKTQSIVVTVQYRVGVLGFLDAPELGITGNMGVHDQLMALKWIRRNIAAFGGDAERTTLMGRFSGSMTISTMITAPNKELMRLEGRPLFNRVVLLSGVAVDDWIIEANQAEKVESLIKSMCKPGDLPSKCLRNIPVEKLVSSAGYGWKLVADDELISRTGGPIEAVKRNQFDSSVEAVLLGETGSEGTLCLYRHLLNEQSDFAKMIEENRLTSEDLNEIIRDDTLAYFKYNVSESNPVKIALETAFSNGNESATHRQRYLDACSSYMVKSHTNRFKRNLLARNRILEKSVDKRPTEIYHYELNYKPSFSLAPSYVRTAAHGDDIPLIFGLIYNQNKQQVNQADLTATKRLMSYIGNFVHGADPQISRDQQDIREEDESSGLTSKPLSRQYWTSESHLAITAATINLVSESASVSTVIILGTCIVVLALTTYCFILSLIVFRYQSTISSHQQKRQTKQQFQVSSSTSSCNICDESQGGSIDEVLASKSKDNRGFCNVFAKLRPSHHHHHQQTPGPVAITTNHTH